MYAVYLLASDGAVAKLTGRASSASVAEAVALATISDRRPGRGWLVSHVEEEA